MSSRQRARPLGAIDHRDFTFPIFIGADKAAPGAKPKYQQGMYRGTGFTLLKDEKLYFVTAAHVLDQAGLLDEEGFIFYLGRAEKSEEDWCSLKAFTFHPSADLAYLELEDGPLKARVESGALTLASENLWLGDEFLTAGYPFTGKTSPITIGLGQFVFRGWVNSRVPKADALAQGLEKPAEWNAYLSIDAARGLSGAPLIALPAWPPRVAGVITGSKGLEIDGEVHRFGVATELDELQGIGKSW